MKIKELINEIGLADEIPKLQLDPKLDTIVRTMDNENIYKFVDKIDKVTVFYFVTDNKIDSYVVIGNKKINGRYPIRRIENINKQKGRITALILYIKSKYKKLVITHDEGLTNDGVDWIVNIANKPNSGMTIVTNTGEKPTKEKLQDERTTSAIVEKPGPTEIYIEGDITLRPSRHKPGGILLDSIKWIGREDIL